MATRLLAVATAEVTQYAPSAPVATQDEAVIRMSGYLDSSRDTAFIQEIKVGDAVDLTFRSAAGSALRASGGMSILSPFKVRRAGICAVVTS